MDPALLGLMETGTAAPPSAKTLGWQGTFGSLSNRDFRYLWLGMLCLMGAVHMQMLAQGYLVYEITSSPALLGVVNSGFAIPMLSLSLFGGAVADRMDRKRIIQAGQAGFALSSVFIGISVATGTVTWVHLLMVSVLMGALFSFIMPARQAIIPQIVGDERLTNAMALNAAGMSATTLVAPAAAGALYAATGADSVYYVTGVLGVISVLITGLLPRLSGGSTGQKAGMARDIGAGLSYIRHSPLVLVLLVIGLVTALLAMPFRFLMPVFVVDVYQKGPQAMGMLVTTLGLGALVGSLAIAALGKVRRGLILIGGTFLTGIVLLLVAVFPYYYLAIGLMVLMGLGDAGRMTLSQALIMEVTEDAYRGRVMSVFMMNFGLMPLGVLPAGLAAEFLGGQAAVGILAVLLLAAAAGILITQKTLRELR